MKRAVIRQFADDQRGAVAATYALALIALVVVAGVAFDYARLAGMDSELQNAADQAALAGATQLDGKAAVGAVPGACARAIAAAQGGLVTNLTRLANDGAAGQTRTVDLPTVVFFQTRANAEADTGSFTTADTACDTKAHFVKVSTEARTANYALTPLAGAFLGNLTAHAVAGLGSSVCKVPPIMLCSPNPLQPFNAAAKKGWGVQATGMNNGKPAPGAANDGQTRNTWSPGNFGFLQVEDPTGSASNRNEALLKAIAFENPPLNCTPVGDNKVSTGNPQRLYDALNARFDIYDMPTGGGNVLSPCHTGSCPPAINVVKDLRRKGSGCGLASGSGNGWQVEDTDYFRPVYTAGWGTGSTFQQSGTSIAIMGHPRDNCHYQSYIDSGAPTSECPVGSRFGNGAWGRRDYFAKNHPSATFPPTVGADYLMDPTDANSFTRYGMYKWEITNGIPSQSVSSGNAGSGTRVCRPTDTSAVDRRVMTVAVVSNCAALTGTSTNVVIDEWVDVFLVEPVVDNRPNMLSGMKDSMYMEVIGPSKLAGSGTFASQQVRRDVPYLVR